MSKLTGLELSKFVESKIGTPYVYGAKGSNGIFNQNKLNYLAKNYPKVFTKSYINKAKQRVGKVCTDCSGLISWYTGKNIGSSQMYSSATKRIPISDIDKMPIGTVLWKQGHVGVYVGMVNGISMCVEAKGIDYGTIMSEVRKTKWKYGLLFEDIMSYECKSTVVYPNKSKNPYDKPTRLLEKGSIGNDVKWLQWELLESGITEVKVGLLKKKLTIDGDFGTITEKALIIFQQSAKIGADGKCFTETINALLLN